MFNKNIYKLKSIKQITHKNIIQYSSNSNINYTTPPSHLTNQFSTLYLSFTYHHSFADTDRIGAMIGFIWCMYVQIHIIHILKVAMKTETIATLNLHILTSYSHSLSQANFASRHKPRKQQQPQFPKIETQAIPPIMLYSLTLIL